MRQMFGFGRVLLLILIGSVWLAGDAAAADLKWGKPTPEQDARCDTHQDTKDKNDCGWAYSLSALALPTEGEVPGFFTNTARMGIFKPDGAGPFPALIIMHTCGAVDHDPAHMPFWVEQAIKAGFVAFVLDSWSQRGISEICQSGRGVFLQFHIAVRTRDAYDALGHLIKFPFVDRDRIAAIGFSNGGRVSYQIARWAAQEMYAQTATRFAAAIAVYGKCFQKSRGIEYLAADVERPLLALLGDQDRDGDPADCLPRLEKLRAAGKPVEWHVFPGVGHAWDQPINRTPRTVTYLGSPEGVLFAYDGAAQSKSVELVFGFLSQQFGLPEK